MLKLLTDHNNREEDLVSLSLDEIARLGAKKLLTQALALEVNEYIERNSALRDDEGLRQVVRNGLAKGRKITTGSGTIAVRAPRVEDRRVGHNFYSRILPPYLRKSANVETILPVLYLKGLSGNAFGDALPELFSSIHFVQLLRRFILMFCIEINFFSLKNTWLKGFQHGKLQG